MRPRPNFRLLAALLSTGLFLAGPSSAQVPVDEDGRPLEPLPEDEVTAEAATDPAELRTAAELEQLVGPIALYPDDLLAIVLPAATYPLQIVQAARFLDELEDNEGLEPDESWDDSVVALLNYPEVVDMMNDDIDWTWQLGEAVVSQQADVIAAVEAFRDRAHAAGNLKTDERQTVSRNDHGVIEIEPVEEEIIYVPYYEPERVVVQQPRPAYYYYPRPYPVYYYPYPHGYAFHSNFFWGVTTAYSVGWVTDHLHVFHHSYWGHPYYGRTYFDHWWYRRPSITVYNTWYSNDHHHHRPRNPHRDGDYWRPRHDVGPRPGFRGEWVERDRDGRREVSREGYRSSADRDRQQVAGRRGQEQQRFSGRQESVQRRGIGRRNEAAPAREPARRPADAAAPAARPPSRNEPRDGIRFRQRDRAQDLRQSSDRRDETRDPIRFRSRAATDSAGQRVAEGEGSIRFRPRPETSAPRARASAEPRIAERRAATARPSPTTVRRDPPVARPAPATRQAPAPGYSRPEAARRPAMQGPPRRQTTAPAAATRSRPAPAISSPAPSPRMAAPPASSPRAPARASRAAPERAAAGNRRGMNRRRN